MALFSQAPATSKKLVVALTSTAAGVVIADMAGKDIKIIDSQLETVRFTKAITTEEFITTLVKTLSVALETISKRTPLHVADCLMLLGSPWHTSSLSVIGKTWDRDIKITVKEQREKIEAHINQLQKKEGQEKHFTIELIERRLVEIVYNNYTVPTLQNATVKNFELSILSSFSSKSDLDDIRKIIHSYYPHVHFSTASLIGSCAERVGKIPDSLDDSIVFDISGEITDTAVLHNDRIKQIVSVPYGMDAILRTLEQQCGTTSEVADSILLRAIEETTMPTHATKKIAKTCDITLDAIGGWAKLVAEALLTKDRPALPTNVFVSAIHPKGSIISTIMTHPKVIGTLFTGTKPNVVFLGSLEDVVKCSLEQQLLTP